MKNWLKDKISARNKKNWVSGLLRFLYYRLIIPVLRSVDHPYAVARGVMIGLMVGATPTVGLQVVIIFGLWWFCNTVLKWKFSLILAMAWSCYSNALTMIPLYYLFYLSGSLLLLDFGQSQDFGHFEQALQSLKETNEPFWHSFHHGVRLLWEKVGLSIFVGSVPYALVMGFTGYWLSLRLAISWMKHKNARRQKNRRGRNG